MWSLYSYLKFGSIPVAYLAFDNCVWIMNFSPPMLGNDEESGSYGNNSMEYEDVRSYGDENILKIIAWIMNMLWVFYQLGHLI
jgi:hypothetical protein